MSMDLINHTHSFFCHNPPLIRRMQTNCNSEKAIAEYKHVFTPVTVILSSLNTEYWDNNVRGADCPCGYLLYPCNVLATFPPCSPQIWMSTAPAVTASSRSTSNRRTWRLRRSCQESSTWWIWQAVKRLEVQRSHWREKGDLIMVIYGSKLLKSNENKAAFSEHSDHDFFSQAQALFATIVSVSNTAHPSLVPTTCV